jgi:Cysteine-rich CPCC
MADRFACPCCGYLTFREASYGSFSICPVCFWEDDPGQLADPTYRGGANIPSLIEARENFQRFGAMEERFQGNVRPPLPEEVPPDSS